MMICAVGCTFKPVENWQAVLPAVTAPSNYKDPAKIQSYIQEKLAELVGGKAATEPLSGAISEAVIMAQSKDEMKPVVVKSGVELAEALAKILYPNMTLVGHRIHKAMRFAAIDYLIAKKELPRNMHWMLDADPVRPYGRAGGYLDPISMLFGSSDTDLEAAARRLNLSVVPTSARSMAELALVFGIKLGL